MGGGDVQNVGECLFLGTGTAAVKRDAHTAHPVLSENGGDLVVARIFDAVGQISAKKLNDQTHQIFRSGTHYDLRRVYRQPAEGGKIACDGCPQLCRSPRRAGGKKLSGRAGENLP